MSWMKNSEERHDNDKSMTSSREEEWNGKRPRTEDNESPQRIIENKQEGKRAAVRTKRRQIALTTASNPVEYLFSRRQKDDRD